MITNSERLRLMQAQLAKCEEAREAAELRANHAVVALAQERARLAFATYALRAVAANDFSAERMRELALEAIRELGS